MNKWTRVEILPKTDHDEVEIAFWDGIYMCRTFGAYDFDKEAWYSGQERIEKADIVVTHWRYPEPLPAPPLTTGSSESE